MARPIDSQRQKLYKAEQVLRKEYCRYEFTTIEEVTVWVQQIMHSAWWKKHYPNHYTLEISNGAGKTKALGAPRSNGIWMALPTWARKDCVILHEMAHGVCPRHFAAHGREYAAIYLKLVTRFMGKKAGQVLRKSFVHHKVKYKPKRVLSPEQKELAISRIRSFQKKKLKKVCVFYP
jgi:putative metallohydrolase (TIGR04338 family)